MAYSPDTAVLERPDKFNFATDVVDYWAQQPGNLNAMLWVSQDQSEARWLTYSHFSRQSHRISALLEKIGISEGDTMVMVVPRVPAWWEIATAAIRSAIILSPATTLLTDKDIRYRCNKTEASIFVGDVTSVRKFLAVRKDCPSVRTVVQIGGAPSPGTVDFYSALEQIGYDTTFKSIRRDWSYPSLTYFTSGTSGPPKMVRHNQVYPLALKTTAQHWYRLSPGKMLWNTAEQGWAKAAWSFFGPWACGAVIFAHDDRRAFDPRRLIDILHRYPVDVMCAAPLAYRHLVLRESKEYFAKNIPKSLSHCTSAGEALNDEVVRQWSKMTGAAIHDGYGQTETVLLCANVPSNPIRPGSMGKPVPGIPLMVIGSNGGLAASGEEGDIAVLLSSPDDKKGFFGIFDGYIQDDQTLTRREKSFTASGGQTKTYYLTGDRARRDEDGYIWFVGRSDDVINSSGYRIGPFEVESTLKMHPSVAESAVVSSPDPRRGEVVKAFVVLTPDYRDASHASLCKELQDFCKTNAAPYKYPRKIQFVEPSFLPKTTSGKIQRNLLKKLEWRTGVQAKL